jgi:hypothetical protein
MASAATITSRPQYDQFQSNPIISNPMQSSKSNLIGQYSTTMLTPRFAPNSCSTGLQGAVDPGFKTELAMQPCVKAAKLMMPALKHHSCILLSGVMFNYHCQLLRRDFHLSDRCLWTTDLRLERPLAS